MLRSEPHIRRVVVFVIAWYLDLQLPM